ncbi:MAG: DUF2809 domain-containing protein [Candidatus Electrothrix sp. GM3_4]|nr:DUF2809 domain-containing protein [Candidatus Electrothrix sp. GM3_4]
MVGCQIYNCCGLPTRLAPQYLPSWYVAYAGDFLWAMLVFFLYALLFRLPTKFCFCIALITAYLIEMSQLFHPAWLDYLRSIRLLGFVLGFGFLWTDLIAYTLGIALATGIDLLIIRPKKQPFSSKKTFIRDEKGVERNTK